MDVLEVVLITVAVACVASLLAVIGVSMFTSSQEIDLIGKCVLSVAEKPGTSVVVIVHLSGSIYVRDHALYMSNGLTFPLPRDVIVSIVGQDAISPGTHYVKCTSYLDVNGSRIVRRVYIYVIS